MSLSRHTVQSSAAAIAMAGLFGVALFGLPHAAGDSLDVALHLTTRQIATGHAHEALAILLPLRQAQPDQPIIDRQIARAYAALGRPADEANAWTSFLRKSPVVADACRRVDTIRRAGVDESRLDIVRQRCVDDERRPARLSELARGR